MKGLSPFVPLVKVPVTAFEPACQFYRDVLGLEEEFAVAEYGWAQYKAGAVPLCLYVSGMGGGDGAPGHELDFHLAVSDVRRAFDAVRARGATIACEVVESDDGGRFFIVQDPDGNRLKIVEAAAPSAAS